MLTATLQERMAAQVAERRETGRPLQAGDLVHARSEFREVIKAGNACECAEARVELDILARRSERRGDERL
jgi:hypothetical protein